MKNLLFVLLSFSAFSLQNLNSQPAERSLPAGFSSYASLVKPYGDDKWVLAGRGMPKPGVLFQDTLFIMVFDNNGQIHLRKNLKRPDLEVNYWNDLLALPDGGVLAALDAGLCDVSFVAGSVQKLDADGNLVWEIEGSDPIPPYRWFLAPDGNLLGAAYNEIWKVNPSNGDILWKAALQVGNGGGLNPWEFALIDGSEDFFAIGDPSFQIWRKIGDPMAPTYILEKSLDLSGYRRMLTPADSSSFYCWQTFPDKRIEQINLDLQLETLPIQIEPYGIKSIAIGAEGVYLSESSSNQHRIRRFDFQGENPVNIHHSELWLNPLALCAHNGSVAVVGSDGSSGNPSSYTYDNAVWLRTFPESNPNPSGNSPNVSITQVLQNSTIDTSRFFSFPFYLYSLFGGGFQIEIANIGNSLVENVAINVAVGYSESFCQVLESKQGQFFHLDLVPGESTWVDFGNISAEALHGIPAEICFWTCSPDEQPDAMHEDDRLCHPVTYTVGVNDLSATLLSISPNPAEEAAVISMTENMAGEVWQIFDLAGQLKEKGICPENSQTLRLETTRLPSGLYLVLVGNQVAKLAVQH